MDKDYYRRTLLATEASASSSDSDSDCDSRSDSDCDSRSDSRSSRSDTPTWLVDGAGDDCGIEREIRAMSAGMPRFNDMSASPPHTTALGRASHEVALITTLTHLCARTTNLAARIDAYEAAGESDPEAWEILLALIGCTFHSIRDDVIIAAATARPPVDTSSVIAFDDHGQPFIMEVLIEQCIMALSAVSRRAVDDMMRGTPCGPAAA